MNKESFPDKEHDFMKRVSQGDERAFAELYELTHRKVYFYLYRLLQGREEAEDVLVETYSEVWRGAKRFMGNARVTTWIIGIARNLAMNTWRKVKTHDSIEDHPHLSSRTVSDAEPFDRQRLIDKAMAGLSTKHREVLDLVFLQEFNYQEVSEVLNIPVNTVKTRVFYAKGAIKETLSRMGVRRDDI